MQLTIGQKVAYPNQGVCLVEAYKEYTCGTRCISGYSLRVLNDNSTIFVPEENAGSVGIRPPAPRARLPLRMRSFRSPMGRRCSWMPA